MKNAHILLTCIITYLSRRGSDSTTNLRSLKNNTLFLVVDAVNVTTGSRLTPRVTWFNGEDMTRMDADNVTLTFDYDSRQFRVNISASGPTRGKLLRTYFTAGRRRQIVKRDVASVVVPHGLVKRQGPSGLKPQHNATQTTQTPVGMLQSVRLLNYHDCHK